MKKEKYTFPEPYCPDCHYHQTVGDGAIHTRYCNGFSNKRKSRRFGKSDPKCKPPKWCPRLISPPACRVYGFVDRDSEMMHWTLNRKDAYSCEQADHISVSERHYRLRLEAPLGMNARQFYNAAQLESVRDIFSGLGVQMEHGEVIKIGDGLKPYYFYCSDEFEVIPLTLFDRSRVQPSGLTPSAEGGEQGGVCAGVTVRGIGAMTFAS